MSPLRWGAGLIIVIGTIGCAASAAPTAQTTPTTSPTITPAPTDIPTTTPTATSLPEPEEPARPPAVIGFDLLSDPEHHRVLLINGLVDGANPANASNELWTWDGQNWQLASKFSGVIPPRSLAAAAMMGQHGLAVFGGWDGSVLRNDTWVLNHGQWQQLDVDGPGPRDHIAAAYDAARDMMVFQSGSQLDGSAVAETWGFDGSKWTLLATDGPGARAHYGIAYDAARQQVILFGGADGSHSLNDLWAWDGTRWTEIDAGDGPSPRDAMAMAYDPSTESILVFGGRGSQGQQQLGDFWRWDGTKWNEITAEGPEGRSFAEMAYDVDRGRMVMFGGYTGIGFNHPTNETWEWDGTRWEKVDG